MQQNLEWCHMYSFLIKNGLHTTLVINGGRMQVMNINQQWNTTWTMW